MKEIIEFLDYLKDIEYIQDYNIEETYITLKYGLSSVGTTERSIDIDEEDNDIIRFLNTLLISTSDIASDIYDCLTDENDFYGYSNEKELEDRIEEETYYLTNIINIYKKWSE